ncbi:MAG TPA: hypothetical protein VHS06_12605 [Chloroflexota bacterium]|nr:hypothetical protein [Chloroflexota bacterium]
MYQRVQPSLVAVQYTWESELGRRDVIGAGVVVGEDGTVMTSLALVDQRIPDDQMKDFKILLPTDSPEVVEEVDAQFLGRDERGDVAFVKAKPGKEARAWQAVRFVDRAAKVGEMVWSVGLLPKMAGYKAAAASAYTPPTSKQGARPAHMPGLRRHPAQGELAPPFEGGIGRVRHTVARQCCRYHLTASTVQFGRAHQPAARAPGAPTPGPPATHGVRRSPSRARDPGGRARPRRRHPALQCRP